MSAHIKETSASYVKGMWKPEEDYCSDGLGVEGEGEILHVKFHTITAKDKVERYIVARLQITCAFDVVLDKYGVERSVDAGDYMKDERSLDADAFSEKMKPADGILDDSSKPFVHPQTSGVVEVLALATSDARHWHVGEGIHFKTNGNSCFLKTFFYTHKGNFGDSKEGEVMNQMSMLSDQYTKTSNGLEHVEGCDSDEWDDDSDED
eukprot:m.27137 g.27137  ORF g.27137 m.27137 type:complete len:207 (-) comp9324_c0_seq1:50-670(-)